jgi:hypothetical protein
MVYVTLQKFLLLTQDTLNMELWSLSISMNVIQLDLQ